MTQQTTHLWEQVKEWLDGLDFAPSQSRLGEKVGVARSAVTAWKLGKAYPTPEHLAALARVMDSANTEAVYNRLLDATLRDQGYVPMPEEGGGAHAGGAAPKTPPGSGPDRPPLLAVASGDEGDEKLAREATEQARRARAEQMDAIAEMKRKKKARDEGGDGK